MKSENQTSSILVASLSKGEEELAGCILDCRKGKIFQLPVACIKLQAEVISGLRLVVYWLMKLFRGMHVGIVRLEKELSCKKTGLERIEAAESLSWNCSFSLLICGNLSLIVGLAS